MEIWLLARVNGLERSDDRIARVVLENGTAIDGDVFVDATGSFGPQSFCAEFGNGCAMCIMRCPTFGPRVSVTGLAGIGLRNGASASVVTTQGEMLVRKFLARNGPSG